MAVPIPSRHDGRVTDPDDVYAWAARNRCFPQPNPETGKVDRQNATHLLMDGYNGGVLKVPDHLNLEFLRHYAASVFNGKRLFVSEQRTPIFKMYYDLDIKRKEYHPPSATFHPAAEADESDAKVPLPDFAHHLDERSFDVMVLQYCRDMMDTIRLFFPPETDPQRFVTVVCCRKFELQSKEFEPRTYSLGVHVIMPNLYVNATQARIMREAAVGRFRNLYGSMEEVQNSWETILDDAVYVGNGLRMLGSRKATKCTECKADKTNKMNCNACNFTGKLDIGRVYVPWKVLRPAAQPNQPALEDPVELAKLKNVMEYQVECTSVRLFKVDLSPDWKPYPGCPVVPELNVNSIEVEIDGKKQLRFQEDAQALNRIRNKIYLPHDPEQFGLMEAYLRTMISPAKYKGLSVHAIFTNPSGKWYVVDVVGDGSSFCMNVDRDHKSNRIYFLMTADGLYQKCFCRCDTLVGRRFGLCKNYSSRKFPITTQLKAAFFKDSVTLEGRTATRAAGLHTIATELRNNTLRRTTPHRHAQAVDRAVNFLRAWLRETYEERHGTRPLPSKFNRKHGGPSAGGRPTAVTKPHQASAEASGGGTRKRVHGSKSNTPERAARSILHPEEDDDRVPPPPKKRVRKPRAKPKAAAEAPESDEEYTCP